MINALQIKKIVNFVKSNNLETKIYTTENKIFGWNKWVTIPVKGYLDFGMEPILFSEVKAIEIKSYKLITIGTRVPSKKINLLNEFEINLKNIPFTILENDDVIRIDF